MNFSITINGEGQELANALKTLRSVMDSAPTEGSVTATFQPAPVAPEAPQVTATQQNEFQAQANTTYPAVSFNTPPVQQPPVQQQQWTPPPQAGAVPTSAPSYSMEQLGVAAGPLVDAGRGPELTGWLNQRGASSLTQLDKALYGEFATYLRSLGAKI